MRSALIAIMACSLTAHARPIQVPTYQELQDRADVVFSLVNTTSAGILVPLALTSDLQRDFSLSNEVAGIAKTLLVWSQEYDPSARTVVVGGVDWSRPGRPYTFDWGDGAQSEGEWPQKHVYRASSNYIIHVTSHHPVLGPATNTFPLRFVPSVLKKLALPSELRVRILDHSIAIEEPDAAPQPVDFFGPRFFQSLRRDDVEYVLHAAACVEYDLSNGDVFLADGSSFQQVIYRNVKVNGMNSHWDSTPVALEAGDYAFKPPIQYSSFFHEMGHNFNLNSPAGFRYGGRANGCASSIYTETLAQIVQYATACALSNHRDLLGLDDFTVLELKVSATDHVRRLRDYHEKWVAKGMKFRSWDDSADCKEDVEGTFMTLAYKFVQQVELAGKGCRVPVKRMMNLLQCFNDDWRIRWGQLENSAGAESFRATLMVAAISYGLRKDMRNEFKEMHYPIDDQVYSGLLQAAETKNRTGAGIRPYY